MSDGAFYLTMECEKCEETIYHGICLTTEVYNGLPAIPFDMASQTRFDCKHCDARHYTSDFDDVLVEGGSDSDDSDDEDDD